MVRKSDISLTVGMGRDEAYIQGIVDGQDQLLTVLETFANDPEGFGRPSDRLWDRLIAYLKELRD